jgi:hypothetical protein
MIGLATAPEKEAQINECYCTKSGIEIASTQGCTDVALSETAQRIMR